VATQLKKISAPPAGKSQAGRRTNAAPRKAQYASAPVDKTLTKGLDLLETLSASEDSRGISELAHELSLNKSNVHRLLQTLIHCGYAMREEGTDRYLLSSKLWRMSRRGKPFDTMRRIVRPALRALVSETGESVVFAIVDADEMILIDQVETQSPVRVFFSVGQSFPIDQVVMGGNGLTALQMVALAHRSEREARTAVLNAQRQLRKNAAFADQQLSKISAVRKNGHSLNLGAWVAGVNAIAVPVVDKSQGLIGVLSCFGPAARLPETALARTEKMLRAKARELSRLLCE
jgi:IclR family KDG regulon transcriptional repressor